MPIRLLAALALAPAVLLAACGGDDDDNGGATTAPAGGEAETLDVTATDFAFDASELSASAGGTLTIHLVNDGAAPHSFTIDGVIEVEADGGAEATSDSFTVPEGDVMFYCKYHPTQMQGTLAVEGDSARSEPEQQQPVSGAGAGYSY
jgi:plastocyanin